MNTQYNLKGRIWIEIGNKTVIGEGKASLIKMTAELGSLRKAAGALELSYRQAWYSINQMNKSAGKPLILLQHGGKNGGIAQITDLGKEILNIFETSQNEFGNFLKTQTIIMNTHSEHSV